MRLIKISILILFLSSQVHAAIPFLPTKLKITVLDDTGQQVKKATVKVFLSKEDYLNNENAVETARTNEKGDVMFKGLKPKTYFIEVEKGSKNNNGMGVRTDKLNEGKVNKLHIIIS